MGLVYDAVMVCSVALLFSQPCSFCWMAKLLVFVLVLVLVRMVSQLILVSVNWMIYLLYNDHTNK